MNRMHRSIATTLVAAAALLLNTVATPAWASTTSSTGTTSTTGTVVTGIESVDGPNSHTERPVSVYQSPARHVDSGLNVTVTEACGGASNDSVVRLNEACTVTATVTNGTGPVGGATVQIDGAGVSPSPVTTNAAGVASLTFTPVSSGYFYVDASDNLSSTGWAEMFVPEIGKGALFVDFRNVSGVTSFGWSLGDSHGSSSSWGYDIAPTYIARNPGTYGKVIVMAVGDGVGYLKEAGPITIAEGAATKVVVDGSGMVPVSIATTWNGSPVSGAEIIPTGLTIPGPQAPTSTYTKADGTATVYVAPGSDYQFGALGGSPVPIFAVTQQTVSAAASVAFSLGTANSAAVTFTAPTDANRQLWIAPGNSGWGHEFRWNQSGTLHLQAGDYLLEGYVTYGDWSTEVWQYYFLPAAGDMWTPSPYAAGKSYDFNVVGSSTNPWQLTLQAPTQATVNRTARLSAALSNGLAKVIQLEHYGTNWTPLTPPLALAVSPGGPAINTDWNFYVDWTPAAEGAYTFGATLTKGVFAWTGLTTNTASQAIQVGTGSGTYQLVPFSHPRDVSGDLVRPAGAFSLDTEEPHPANTVTPHALNLTYTFDPTQVSYDARASYAGSGSLAGDGTNGTIQWTWSAARTGDLPTYPDLVFHVANSFTGSSVDVGLNGTGTDTSGAALAVTPVTQHVGVAVRAVTISVAVQGGMQARAVITGANSTQNCERLQDGSGDLICLNPDAGIDTILAGAPGALRAETQVNVPPTGTTNAGALSLPFGDLDGDNEVTAADLEFVKNAFGFDSFFTSLADGNLDQEVDIYDLVMTAANQGVAESLPTSGGAVAATINNLPVTTKDKTGMVLLVNHQDSVENAWAAWYVNLGKDSTATVSLAGLPRGSWDLYVVLPDGSQAMSAVDITGSTPVNQIISFPVTP